MRLYALGVIQRNPARAGLELAPAGTGALSGLHGGDGEDPGSGETTGGCMMNTADRSLAMIDYALRRRFSFFDMEPGFDSEGFRQYQASLNNETLNALVERVKDLNKEIAADKSLGKGFCIGHSYFCGQDTCTDEWLDSIVNYDILPMLSEYWFDDTAKLQRWENILRGVLQ